MRCKVTSANKMSDPGRYRDSDEPSRELRTPQQHLSARLNPPTMASKQTVQFLARRTAQAVSIHAPAASRLAPQCAHARVLQQARGLGARGARGYAGAMQQTRRWNSTSTFPSNKRSKAYQYEDVRSPQSSLQPTNSPTNHPRPPPGPLPRLEPILDDAPHRRTRALGIRRQQHPDGAQHTHFVAAGCAHAERRGL